MFGQVKVGHIPTPAAGGADTTIDGYNYLITNSCRFNMDDSAHLTRTPSSASNRDLYTASVWLKRSQTKGSDIIFEAGTLSPNSRDFLAFDAATSLSVQGRDAAAIPYHQASSEVFRDHSAWWHIVWIYDSENAVATERNRLYLNGERIVDLSTDTTNTQNRDSYINNTSVHYIGSSVGTNYWDGYMADFNFIDGQGLGPEYFGEFNSNGMWRPIDTAGLTFGTNGFRLEFKNSAALGTDTSGNGNDFTPSGLAATDQMTDTPTLDATTGIGNLCTLNPLHYNASTFSNNNLTLTTTNAAGGFGGMTCAIPVGRSSNKYVFEVVIDSGSNDNYFVGVNSADNWNMMPMPTQDTISYSGGSHWTAASVLHGNNPTFAYAASETATGFTGKTFTVGDVIGVEVDCSTGLVEYYKDGVSQFVQTDYANVTALTDGDYFPNAGQSHGAASATTLTYTFELADMAYAGSYDPASLSISVAGLPDPAIQVPQDHFEAITYTGNATADRRIRGLNFRPDLVWIKNRDQTDEHKIMDSVRGPALHLSSDSMNVEAADTGALQSFDEGGWTMGTGANGYNDDGEAFVAWCWNAGDGDPVQNNDGSIQSLVKANTTAGFSIVSFDFPASGTHTVGHGLTQAPDFIVTKDLTDGAYDWVIQHKDVAAANILRFTDAIAGSSTAYNSAYATATTFQATTSLVSASSPAISYCWHSVEGFSKFGSYRGNASSDGPFIYTGFKPGFILIKKTTTAANNWSIHDSTRSQENPSWPILRPDLTAIEQTAGSGQDIDILSNGFKIRNGNHQQNGTGETYIYAAFAEQPFKYTTGN